MRTAPTVHTAARLTAPAVSRAASAAGVLCLPPTCIAVPSSVRRTLGISCKALAPIEITAVLYQLHPLFGVSLFDEGSCGSDKAGSVLQ